MYNLLNPFVYKDSQTYANVVVLKTFQIYQVETVFQQILRNF